MELTNYQREAVWIVMCVCGALSAIGSGFICMMYMSFPNLRGYSFRLVYYLSLADLLYSIAYILPDLHMESWCWIKGLLLTFSFLWCLFLTAVIARSIYISFTYELVNFVTKEYVYLAIVGFISLTLSVLPLTADAYGVSDGFCWIRGDGDAMEIFWRLSVYYIPLWAVTIYNICAYLKVIRAMNRQLGSVADGNMYTDEVIKKLKLYPLILVICLTPEMANRFYNWVYPDSQNFYFTCVAYACQALMGLFNAIFYGFTPTVKMEIIGVICPRRYERIYGYQKNVHMSVLSSYMIQD
jgi:hypothetical protein